MEQIPLVPMDMPATYRICVTGGLENSWTERYWGMTSSRVEQIGGQEQTALVGDVRDQSALVGIINALYNSGHTVVSVERLEPGTKRRQDDADEEA